jgi:hypothetical protein
MLESFRSIFIPSGNIAASARPIVHACLLRSEDVQREIGDLRLNMVGSSDSPEHDEPPNNHVLQALIPPLLSCET